LKTGRIAAGTAISAWEKAATPLSIADLMSLYLTGRSDAAKLATAVDLPGLSAAWHETLSEFLASARR
jgi:MOSC domain-containing protein YiiM